MTRASNVKERRERIADALISVAIAVSSISALVILIEAVEWLITGHWPGWSVEDGFLFFGAEEPLLRFDAAQFVVDLLVDLPVAVALYIVGLCLFLLATEHIDPM